MSTIIIITILPGLMASSKMFLPLKSPAVALFHPKRKLLTLSPSFGRRVATTDSTTRRSMMSGMPDSRFFDVSQTSAELDVTQCRISLVDFAE